MKEAEFSSLDNEVLLALDDKARAKKVGFVFENPEWGFLCARVDEDIAFSFAALDESPPHSVRLRQYNLWDAQSQAPETLSGGEQQRLACLPTMERVPPVAIFDFMSANIDATFRKSFAEWVREACRDRIVIVRGFPGDLKDLGPTQSLVLRPDGNIQLSETRPAEFPELEIARDALGRRLKPRTPGEQILLAHDFSVDHMRQPFSLKVEAGQVVRLLGPNGIGKTTFLRFLTQRGRKQRYKGEVNLSPEALPAISFQHPEHSTAAFQLRHEVQDAKLLASLDIPDDTLRQPAVHAARYARKLVSLAAACELSGKLVLWDEPTVTLDFSHKQRVIDIINAFPKKAFLIVTHDAALDGIGDVVDLEKP